MSDRVYKYIVEVNGAASVAPYRMEVWAKDIDDAKAFAIRSTYGAKEENIKVIGLAFTPTL